MVRLVYTCFSLVFFLFISCSNDETPEKPIGDDNPPIVTPPDDKDPDEVILSSVELKADGPGDTYELINSVLAPGRNVVEVPDCNHEEFGRHIEEVYDEILDTDVFNFMIHVTPDNDRCVKFDRQRNEIKTYDGSPDNLKGVAGEKVRYTWKFKLADGFQPSTSFTHIHQIKAVGGSEDSMPLITITPRKSSPNKLQLRYAEDFKQVTLKEVMLEPFIDNWIEATETIVYGEKGIGTFKLELKDVVTQEVLFAYESDDIRMWKTDAEFQRPKWGIYRSLNKPEQLRDESVLFADFKIEEIEN